MSSQISIAKKKNIVGKTVFLFTVEPNKVIDIAKRELEKERELFMSRSMPGLPENSNENHASVEAGNDSESDSESDSEDNGKN